VSYTDSVNAVSRALLSAVVVVAIAATGCATGRAVPQPFPGAVKPPAPPATVQPDPAQPPADGSAALPESPDTNVAFVAPTPGIALLLDTALSLRGIPYRNGGSDLTGFDCSGFVQYVFFQHGRRLPRETRDQYGAGVGISTGEVRPGDLIFFETVRTGASHVGIALDHEWFVHAPTSNGVVRVERYTSRYWATRYVGARRVE
jgi:cell wall-associated NlpC family hydrolase